MKKLILILLIALLSFSCSKEDSDCDSKKAEITKYYDNQIQLTINNGNDQRKIDALYKEKNEELANACK